MLTFKWSDGSEHDFDSLPEASRQAMVNRAVNHIVGNEVASSVVGFIKSEIATAANIKPEAVSRDAIKVYRGENGAVIDAKTAEFCSAKLKAVLDGTLGVRAAGSGPRLVDPVAREIRKIAETEIGLILAAHKDAEGNELKLPRGDATLTLGDATFTRGDLVDRHLAGVDRGGLFGPKGEPNEPRIRKAAERIVAAAKAKAEKATTVAASASLAEALGL
jgi:hypothetical protein